MWSRVTSSTWSEKKPVTSTSPSRIFVLGARSSHVRGLPRCEVAQASRRGHRSILTPAAQAPDLRMRCFQVIPAPGLCVTPDVRVFLAKAPQIMDWSKAAQLSFYQTPLARKTMKRLSETAKFGGTLCSECPGTVAATTSRGSAQD